MTLRRKKRSPRQHTGPRTFTVTRRYIESRFPRLQGEWVPLLRLSGHWLEQCGFDRGARVTAVVEQGKLTLTLCEQPSAIIEDDARETLPLYESRRALAAQRTALPPAAVPVSLPAGLRPPSGPSLTIADRSSSSRTRRR